MSRSQFDQEYVLQQAQSLFWQNGYYATSMQQIITATGLKPGSLYLAFGNKAGLFQAVLDHYANNNIDKIKECIEHSPSPQLGICNFFIGLVDSSCQSNYNGCLLINSKLELAANDDSLYKHAINHLNAVEAYFASVLADEMPLSDAQTCATSILLHIFGLQIYGFSHSSAQAMLNAIRHGLAWLPWTEALAASTQH